MQHSLSSLARALHAGICSPNTPSCRTLWAALCNWYHRLGCQRPWQTRVPLIAWPPGDTQLPCVASSATTNSGQEIHSPRVGVWAAQKDGFCSSPLVELQSSCRPGGGELCSAEMDSAVQQSCAALPSSRCSGGLGGVLISPQTFTHLLRTLQPLPLPCSCWH